MTRAQKKKGKKWILNLASSGPGNAEAQQNATFSFLSVCGCGTTFINL